MENTFDAVVIGGGVIGACIFDDLVLSGYRVVLLERGGDVSVGTSKANSGIVHAGHDAKPGTKKAIFNVEGSEMYPAMCSRLGVRLGACGAYVVGGDFDKIQALYDRGITNNVKGLEILNREQLIKRLPNLQDSVICGLFASTSKIVSPYMLTICLAEEGILNGGQVELNFDVNSVKKENDYYVVSNGLKEYKAKYVINSTGNNYNNVAKIIGSETYNIEFKRGEYYLLDHSELNLVPSTIFPLPSAHSKGVLVTPTVDGNVIVGPTSYESSDSVKTTEAGLKEVKEKSSEVLNNINLKKTIRVFSGVRAIVGDDFVIEKSKLKENIINLAGICSPGLSAAPAISKYVINELMGLKYDLSKNAKQKVASYDLSKYLSNEKLNELIKQNPDYGQVVCKCEDVTVGDIKMALNRPLKVNSVDGIKRRVRAGMGRCQGGFCLDKVISIIANTREENIEDVLKENVHSNIIIGNIKEV